MRKVVSGKKGEIKRAITTLFILQKRFTKTIHCGMKYFLKDLYYNSKVMLKFRCSENGHKILKKIPQFVLTLPIKDKVKILKIIGIPFRRGPFLESMLCYEDLTPKEKKRKY